MSRGRGRFAQDPEVVAATAAPDASPRIRGRGERAAAAVERHDLALLQPPLPAASTALRPGYAAAGAVG